MPTISDLKALESRQNDGRGVQCIKSIISTLEHRNYSTAVYIAIHDNDKIRNYPELQTMLRKMLPDYDAHLTKIEKLFGE